MEEEMITWRERIDKAFEAWHRWDDMPTELRMDRVFKEAGVRDLVIEVEDLTSSQEQLLDLLEEVMGHDKGMREEEWVEFCNRILPLMHTHERLTSVVEYIE
jgi:hypothetical protein